MQPSASARLLDRERERVVTLIGCGGERERERGGGARDGERTPTRGFFVILTRLSRDCVHYFYFDLYLFAREALLSLFLCRLSALDHAVRRCTCVCVYVIRFVFIVFPCWPLFARLPCARFCSLSSSLIELYMRSFFPSRGNDCGSFFSSNVLLTAGEV